MTDSKKTEPVDNFPYLVYTDEADRTYDGNGGGGGGGDVPKIRVYVLDKEVSEGTYALDIVTCKKITKLGESETIDISGVDEYYDNVGKCNIYAFEFDAGSLIYFGCGFNSFVDADFIAMAVANGFKISGVVIGNTMAGDTADVGLYFAVPNYDFTDVESTPSASDIFSANVPYILLNKE